METINTRHIEKRARDLKKNINSLFREIKGWLRNTEFRFEDSKPIVLNESIIDELDAQKYELPTANIYKNNTLIASLKPKGLWVIGGNGRVDLISNSELILLLDNSEQSEKSNWEIVFGKNRKTRNKLKENNFLQILSTL